MILRLGDAEYVDNDACFGPSGLLISSATKVVILQCRD